MGTLKPYSHADLVIIGARWARKNGFGVVFGELTSAATREIPDVVAFNGHCTIVIEAKTSRSDFLVDRKKPWRQPGQGIGHYRFYLAPPGLIAPEELPKAPRWGLIEVGARGVAQVVVGPHGGNGISNLWPDDPHSSTYDRFLDRNDPNGWAAFWHPSDLKIERNLLYSIARRKQASPNPPR